jgi:hypothetical protein
MVGDHLRQERDVKLLAPERAQRLHGAVAHLHVAAMALHGPVARTAAGRKRQRRGRVPSAIAAASVAANGDLFFMGVSLFFMIPKGRLITRFLVFYCR